MVGEYGKKIGDKNRVRVFLSFTNNPFQTQVECARELNLSKQTVHFAYKAIRNGWRPSSEDG